jgi:hypothetical protein
MMSIDLSRRHFLRSSGLAVATATALAAGLAGVRPGAAWALQPKAIDAATAQGLLKMSRTLYPHAMLDDAYYAKVVDALDAGAAADPAFAKMLRDGIAQLAASDGTPFEKLSAEKQLVAITAVQKSEFFEAVRSTTVWTLYSNPEVWRHFDYEGSSVEHGGYLERGFDDIAWLPKD